MKKSGIINPDLARELAAQEMVLLEGIKTANPELDQAIGALRTHQELRYVSLPEFRNQAKGAAFYVRTGETLPCSNIYLVSASGVAERAAYYDIAIEAAEV